MFFDNYYHFDESRNDELSARHPNIHFGWFQVALLFLVPAPFAISFSFLDSMEASWLRCLLAFFNLVFLCSAVVFAVECRIPLRWRRWYIRRFASRREEALEIVAAVLDHIFTGGYRDSFALAKTPEALARTLESSLDRNRRRRGKELSRALRIVQATERALKREYRFDPELADSIPPSIIEECEREAAEAETTAPNPPSPKLKA